MTNNNQKTNKQSEDSGLSTVVERREFYKDMYSKTWKMALTGVITLGLSVGTAVYSVNKEADNKYFAVDQNLNMIKLIALDQPNASNTVVGNWLTKALVDTFDFNYFNMKKQLNDASVKYFTAEGSAELIRALDESGNFNIILDNKLIVNLTVTHNPVIIKEGVIEGYKLWKLQVPATITYRNETSVSSNKVIFTVTVSRVSLLTDPVGLGIAKIIMELDN